MATVPDYISVYLTPTDCDSFAEYVKENEDSIREAFAIPSVIIEGRSPIEKLTEDVSGLKTVVVLPYGRNLYSRKLRIRR